MEQITIEHPVLMCDPFKTPFSLSWRIRCNDTQRGFDLKTLPSVDEKFLKELGIVSVVLCGTSGNELGVNFDAIVHMQNLVQFPSQPYPIHEFPVSLEHNF